MSQVSKNMLRVQTNSGVYEARAGDLFKITIEPNGGGFQVFTAWWTGKFEDSDEHGIGEFIHSPGYLQGVTQWYPFGSGLVIMPPDQCKLEGTPQNLYRHQAGFPERTRPMKKVSIDTMK